MSQGRHFECLDLTVFNFTVYSTDSLVALIQEGREVMEANGVARERWFLGGRLEVRYWQGRLKEPALNVRPFLLPAGEDPQKGVRVLKIKKPERLAVSPVELLAAEGRRIAPSAVSEEVGRVIFGWSWAQLAKKARAQFSLQLVESPEMYESRAEQRQRVLDKKVRRAVRGALGTGGLKSVSNHHAASRWVEALQEVKDHLDEEEQALLHALQAQQKATAQVRAVGRALRARERREGD
ncbi:hypothetical protein CMI37_16385 [Candidatus Pacearchaeota archaeon]|nr:hypothetical protein [Candidatus Pacearchaeota archaeon]|tara:strand:- start:1804 stop:2517 length:714 start_codon:yes stop_codon:yes gene_type:complete